MIEASQKRLSGRKDLIFLKGINPERLDSFFLVSLSSLYFSLPSSVILKTPWWLLSIKPDF